MILSLQDNLNDVDRRNGVARYRLGVIIVVFHLSFHESGLILVSISGLCLSKCFPFRIQTSISPEPLGERVQARQISY